MIISEFCETFDKTISEAFDFINSLDPITEEIKISSYPKFFDNIFNSKLISYDAKKSFRDKFFKRYCSDADFREFVGFCYFIFSKDYYIGAFYETNSFKNELNSDYIIFDMHFDNILFNFPDYILLNIILDQFTLKDIKMLLISTNNKKDKDRLLYIINHPAFIIKYQVKYEKWLNDINIKCENLVITKNRQNSIKYDEMINEYIIKNGIYIKNLSIIGVQISRNDSLIILDSCKNITHFTFLPFPNRESISVKDIYERFEKLEYISLSLYSMNKSEDYISNTNKIKKINLKCGLGFLWKYEDIIKILLPCINLKELTIEEMRDINPQLFIFIADNFKKLEVLVFSNCSMYNNALNDETNEIGNENIKYLVNKLPYLKNINLTTMDNIYYDTLKYIYSTCENIEYIYSIGEIEDSYGVPIGNREIELTQNIRNPSKIKYLELYGYRQLEKSLIKSLSEKFTNIESFIGGFSGLNDEDIITLTKNCTKIKKLDINGNIGYSAIAAIADNLKDLIEFTCMTFTLEDKSMMYLFENSTKLQRIEIENSRNLTDLSLSKIANCKNLKFIELPSTISNECLKLIILNCPLIESIRIISPHGSKTINFEFVVWILENTPNLKNLGIISQADLTNEEIKFLMNKYNYVEF